MFLNICQLLNKPTNKKKCQIDEFWVVFLTFCNCCIYKSCCLIDILSRDPWFWKEKGNLKRQPIAVKVIIDAMWTHDLKNFELRDFLPEFRLLRRSDKMDMRSVINKSLNRLCLESIPYQSWITISDLLHSNSFFNKAPRKYNQVDVKHTFLDERFEKNIYICWVYSSPKHGANVSFMAK